MKKIINLIVVTSLMSLFLPACNLDKLPEGSISTENAFKSHDDALKHRNGLYTILRALQYGAYTQVAEMQSDMFNASQNFGNDGGDVHGLQNTLPGSQYVSALWAGYYSAIAQINNFLEKAPLVRENATSEEQKQIDGYIAEAHYMRAYMYSNLAKYFVQDYEDTDSEWGIPLVEDYNIEATPSRASVHRIYNFIMDELNEAGKISANSNTTSESVNKNAVAALKSKMYLLTHQYDSAYSVAKSLFDNSSYPLDRVDTVFRNGWRLDNTREDIFRLDARITELGMGTYSRFMEWQSGSKKYQPHWIPTQKFVNLYEDPKSVDDGSITYKDFRKDAFLSDTSKDVVRVAGKDYRVYFLKKFPGNPALFTDKETNYMHKPKVARIAEQYLIGAEALFEKGDEAGSREVLNRLREARGASPTAETGDAYKQVLQDEWAREMVGEGVLIECLKRWKVGFIGRTPQVEEAVMVSDDFTRLNCSYGTTNFDHLTLPIPINDLRTNTNLKQSPWW